MESSTEELEKIKGGWKSVPNHLKCKAHLNEMGLSPTGEPVAEVWNSHQWVSLYDIKETRQKRKPTVQQLEALERGRKKSLANKTCKECGYIVQKKNEWIEDGICSHCIKQSEFDKQLIKQKEAIAKLFLSWKDTDFLILDTETTGLGNAEIVEIAIINSKGETLYDSLIKPTIPIPEEASNIHGITDHTVKDAPTWKMEWERIRSILHDRKVLIYNDVFDIGVIQWSCQVNDLECMFIDSGCVMRAYADYIGYDRWLSLAGATNSFTSHRALEDCKSVLGLLQEVFGENLKNK